MKNKKSLLLSMILFAPVFVYTMESKNDELNNSKNEKIDIAHFEILPDEIKVKILGLVLDECDINYKTLQLSDFNSSYIVENTKKFNHLVYLNDLKTVNKGFNECLETYFKDKLIKISKALGLELSKAAHLEDIEKIKKLIQLDVPINIQDTSNGYTAIFYALQNEEIFKLLVQNGADLDIQDNLGFTVLIEACIDGDEDAVKLLIDAGANICIKCNDGKTALDYAINNGWESIVQLLRVHYIC